MFISAFIKLNGQIYVTSLNSDPIWLGRTRQRTCIFLLLWAQNWTKFILQCWWGSPLAPSCFPLHTPATAEHPLFRPGGVHSSQIMCALFSVFYLIGMIQKLIIEYTIWIFDFQGAKQVFHMVGMIFKTLFKYLFVGPQNLFSQSCLPLLPHDTLWSVRALANGSSNVHGLFLFLALQQYVGFENLWDFTQGKLSPINKG